VKCLEGEKTKTVKFIKSLRKNVKSDDKLTKIEIERFFSHVASHRVIIKKN
jgi:hypothetical protein